MEKLEKSLNMYDKDLYEEMKMVDSALSNIRMVSIMGAESYGFTGGKILDDVKILSEDKIRNFEIVDITKFLKDNGHSEDVLVKSHMDSMDHTVPYIEYARNALLELREIALELESSELDRIKLCKEIANAKTEQEKRFRSPEYRQRRSETLAELEKRASEQEYSVEKRRALEKLEMIRNSDTLDFLFHRFDRFSDKEIKNIIDGFLDGKKFEYIWNKYCNNIKHFNILPDVVKRFYNIEEMFLHELYHPFNNLFLFIVIRFIAYMDPHNSRDMLYANALIVKCDHLVYHRFDSQDDEEAFKNTIKTILNMFMQDDYIALFTEKNTSSPTHPQRMLKDDAERKLLFSHFMNTLKFELVDIDVLEYLSNDTSIENMRAKLDDMYHHKLDMVDELLSKYDQHVSVNMPFASLLKLYNEHKQSELEKSGDVGDDMSIDIDDPDLLAVEDL